MSALSQRSLNGFSLLVNNNAFDQASIWSISLSMPPAFVTLNATKHFISFNLFIWRQATVLPHCIWWYLYICKVSVYRLAVLECKTATWWFLSCAALLKSYTPKQWLSVRTVDPPAVPRGLQRPQGRPLIPENSFNFTIIPLLRG